MTDSIEPALSAEEWARRAKIDHDTEGDVGVRVDEVERGVMELTLDVPGEFSVSVPARLLPALIALANAALPDSDPRKIARERIARLHSYTGVHDEEERAFLDALASYLPPETT